MAATGTVTVEGVFTATPATSDALFFASSVSEGFLLSDATSLFTAHGGYGGAAGLVTVRMIYIGTSDREIVLGASPREIVLEAVERVIYVGPLPRDVLG